MPHEYDDPVTSDAIEAAVKLTIELRSRRQSAALDELATEAVDAVFCTCVTSAADACARGRAPTHAGLIVEILRQVRIRSTASATTPAAPIRLM
jgi:hypothetical protein